MNKVKSNIKINNDLEQNSCIRINQKLNNRIEAGCVRVSDALKNDQTECYYPGPASSFIIQVNQKLIQRAIDKGFINELSFYYLLKLNFIHSRISKIDKPKQRISKLTGLSINSINKYFDRLILLGYLKPDRNGWSITTYKTYKPVKIALNEPISLYEIKDALYLKALEIKAYGQSTLNSLETYITGKQAKELPGKMDPDTTSYKPYFSIRYVSHILNISHVSAFTLLHRLRDKGFIKQYFDGSGFVCCGGDPSLLEDLHDYKYIQGAGMYRIEPARYEFLINPIKQKPMTLTRYKKLSKNAKMRKFIDDINLRLTA